MPTVEEWRLMDAKAEIRRLRVVLMKVKELVVGDKIPNWQDNYRTTNTRSQIADLCDLALKD